MKRGTIEQSWLNRVKAIRAVIRLKHSIAADNELNEVLDAERKKYLKLVHGGQFPEAIEVQVTAKKKVRGDGKGAGHSG